MPEHLIEIRKEAHEPYKRTFAWAFRGMATLMMKV
jgi:hypothetical protein